MKHTVYLNRDVSEAATVEVEAPEGADGFELLDAFLAQHDEETLTWVREGAETPYVVDSEVVQRPMWTLYHTGGGCWVHTACVAGVDVFATESNGEEPVQAFPTDVLLGLAALDAPIHEVVRVADWDELTRRAEMWIADLRAAAQVVGSDMSDNERFTDEQD